MKFDDTDPDKIRIAKRIAVLTGGVVALIFCGTAYLGYVYFMTERPAREYFAPVADPSGAAGPNDRSQDDQASR